MQIKHFEAADMTEALRMVKREFGDDAVILSAKEVRPGGFFSALRKTYVEITAATDYPLDDTKDGDAFAGLLAQHLDSEAPDDRVTLSTPPQTVKPLSGKIRPFLHQPPEPEPQRIPADSIGSVATETLPADNLKALLERAAASGIGVVSNPNRDAARGQTPSPEPAQLAARPFYRDGAGQKVIALVGPPGVGKSTTVAKLARHCRVVENQTTGVISLDRFRIGANSMLESVANIMNLPFEIVHDTDQLRSVLNDLADADVILIDTPGMGGMDRTMLDDIGTLLRLARPDETHLVVNATVRKGVLAATVNTFALLGVNRLLFTHMDEYGVGVNFMDLLRETRLPSSFYSDGTDLFDHLQTTTADQLVHCCGGVEPTGQQMVASPDQRDSVSWVSAVNQDGGDADQYVANRNSELFHHINCKSVKRINVENVVAFSSIQQAQEQGFKPCRACCNISVVRKSTAGNVRYQRARAI